MKARRGLVDVTALSQRDVFTALSVPKNAPSQTGESTSPGLREVRKTTSQSSRILELSRGRRTYR